MTDAVCCFCINTLDNWEQWDRRGDYIGVVPLSTALWDVYNGDMARLQDGRVNDLEIPLCNI